MAWPDHVPKGPSPGAGAAGAGRRQTADAARAVLDVGWQWGRRSAAAEGKAVTLPGLFGGRGVRFFECFVSPDLLP